MSYRARFFILVASFGLLISGIGLGLGQRILGDERVALVQERNSAVVRSLASEAGVLVRDASMRARSIAERLAGESRQSLDELQSDPDIVALSVYAPTTRADFWELRATALNAEFAKLYSLNEKTLDRFHRSSSVSFEKVIGSGLSVTSAASQLDAPLAALAIPIRLPGDGAAQAIDAVAVADVRTERWVERVAQGSHAGSTLFLVDSGGEPLAHPDPRSLSANPAAARPIVHAALAQGAPVSGAQVSDWHGERTYGAFARADFGGMIAVAETAEGAALGGIDRLRIHTGLLAALALTLALLGAAWLARRPENGLANAGGEPIAYPELSEEYLRLLRGFRTRIEQIRARALQAVAEAESERLRGELSECGRRLESLGEQAAWAAEIFKKLRRLPPDPAAEDKAASGESEPRVDSSRAMV